MPEYLTQQQVRDYNKAGFLTPIDMMSTYAAAQYRGRIEEAEAAYPDITLIRTIQGWLSNPSETAFSDTTNCRVDTNLSWRPSGNFTQCTARNLGIYSHNKSCLAIPFLLVNY